MTIEYKNLELKKATLKDDDNYYYFEGYASTFDNVDAGNDIVVKGAFVDSLKRQMPKMVYQHNLSDPIGVYTYAKEDDIGLLVKGQLPKECTQSKNVGALMKCGAIDSMSIGFTVDDYSLKDGNRYLTKLTLWEVSPVTIPMNAQAKITNIKGVTSFQDYPIADRNAKWDSAAAIGRIRKFTDSEDEPSTSYKKAFMWFDSENLDKFGSYKLPYVDIINGKMTVIPQAIIAIAGVLNGARGGVDIPKADKDKIESVIKKYYDKMGMDHPFDDEEDKDILVINDDDDDENEEDQEETQSRSKRKKKTEKSLDIWDIKSLDKVQFESVLRESGLFSKAASLYLASFFPSNRSESDVVAKEKKSNSISNEIEKLKQSLQKFKGK